MALIDPTPWLLEQTGLAAVRARRKLGFPGDGDEMTVEDTVRKYTQEQGPDGSFDGCMMKTAAVVTGLRLTGCTREGT